MPLRKYPNIYAQVLIGRNGLLMNGGIWWGRGRVQTVPNALRRLLVDMTILAFGGGRQNRRVALHLPTAFMYDMGMTEIMITVREGGGSSLLLRMLKLLKTFNFVEAVDVQQGTLDESAELYAQLYEQDEELQLLTESAIVGWPE